ncbi:sensor histidine kinase [Rugosimonospora africana]|uniref:histidine kinase n=1 Tax=Rugosimonospora africana TaxID=556532 RepID=A0A8J3QZQ8_9ACTN|nr:nitrate- and nitrite sensing domain-containing protein [Rugosimonospora africana]GIH20269.1 histidine kinase [Rugosimonospora africana]
MLIPSAAAVVLWLVASGYLVSTGFYDREVASTVRQVSIPAVTGLSSIQQERSLSIAYLAHPSSGLQDLIDQRRQTDERLATLRSVANSALTFAPASIKTRWKALSDNLDQLQGVRSTIDAGTANRKHVYDFFNGLLDSATDLFDTQARVVPDVTASQGGIAATETFHASDLMSRAGSTITGAFGSHALSEDDYLQFVGLVGAYHAQLNDLAAHLRPEVRAQYEQLTSGSAWQQLIAAEDTLINTGRWSDGVPHSLAATAASWGALTTQVSDALINLTIAQADEVSSRALHTGNVQLLTAVLGSVLALLIAAGAIWWAVRQSDQLVGKALVVRLGRLGEDAAMAVEQRLPEMMDRLRRQEDVDPAVELPGRDYGGDEIGQLAEALNNSLQVAVGAVIEEAKTRTASMAMLEGVARRPQGPLQQSLQVIERLQKRFDDQKGEVLGELFDVNHKLAQTRRFLENLIILAGGQTGRRFAKPVPVRSVLLAAQAETLHYQRIKIRYSDEIALAGHAVAGTTHLLAELLDNALTFSRPPTEVLVTCRSMGTHRGAVIEIEDAGVGMPLDDLERANLLLANAPTPDLNTIKDGKQVGLWVVAELAKRDKVQVTLRTSAYGGLLAVVLLPDRLIADPQMSTTDTAAAPLTVPAGIHPAMPSQSTPAFAMATSTYDDARHASTYDDARHASTYDDASHTSTYDDTRQPPGQAAATTMATDAYAVTRPTASAPTGGQLRTEHPESMVNDRQSGNIAADPSAADPSNSWVGSASVPSKPRPSRPPLPERKPQRHLAPQLRGGDTSVPSEPAEPTRSPEENRDRFARYQRGRQAGRTDNTAETPTSNDYDWNP